MRIDSRHNVFDHAVFACPVYALEHEQDCPARLRIELILQVGELHNALFKHRGSLLSGAKFSGIGRIEIF